MAVNDTSTACAHVPVKDLKHGDRVLQFFELRAKDRRRTRSGQDFLDLTLGDATGAVVAKMWADAIRRWGEDFDAGDFVKVEGRVESYRDRCQIVVEKIRRAEPSDVPDSLSLIRTGAGDPEALLTELKNMAGSLAPPQLAELVLSILGEHEESLKTYPAARMIHHAYRGGLIEHVLAVTRKVEAILMLEQEINRNLAIAGAILHDIGKILELNPTGRGRTPGGRLLGHVIQGKDLVRDTAVKMGLGDATWLPELEHILLSHHGDPQFGAPVRPLTREALLVHFIDNLDSKLKIMEEALEGADSEGFTPYNKWLEGRVFAGTPFPTEEENNGGDSGEAC